MYGTMITTVANNEHQRAQRWLEGGFLDAFRVALRAGMRIQANLFAGTYVHGVRQLQPRLKKLDDLPFATHPSTSQPPLALQTGL